MGRRLWLSVVVVLMVACFASQSWAQWHEDRPSRYFFDVGAYRPSCSKLADNTGSTWKLLSAGCALSLDSKQRTLTSVELGIAGNTNGNYKGEACSAMFMKTWHGKSASTSNAYCGLGAGLFYNKEKLSSYWANYFSLVPGFSKSGIRPGMCANVGYNFSDSWFAELRYTGISPIGDGLNFSGLSLSGGARFAF